MKITHALTIASALVLAAGCAHEEHQMSYESDSTVTPSYSSGRMSEYNHTENEVGSSYQSGTQSPGTYGTYSSGSSGAYPGATTDNGTANNSYSDNYTSGGAGGESDSALVAQVRESLAQDPEIAPILQNVQISVNNGVVVLNGSIQSEEQKRQIASIVGRASGVVTVNNQLKVMAGPNENGNTGASQLNPTGNAASQRLYKNAGESEGNNNALKPTPMQNGQSQSYQQNTPGTNPGAQQNNSNSLNPTSRTNSESKIYRESPQWQAGRNQNTNNDTSNDALNPTSRPGSGNRIHQQDNPGQGGQMQSNGQLQNTNSNSQHDSTGGQGLNPTSRPNSGNHIYQQNNPGQSGQTQNNGQLQNTNNNSLNDNPGNHELNPTSRPNSGSQIYQPGSPGQSGQMQNNGQMQNTNNNTQSP